MTEFLSSHVAVARRFRRSVRLSDDASDAATGFICTLTAARAIETTINHVAAHKHGAFTWTGPYGCGKSSLATVLAAAVGHNDDDRQRALEVFPSELKSKLVEEMHLAQGGWSVVSLMGQRRDASDLIREALDDAGVGGRGDPISRLVAHSKKGVGTLVLIDEMGKVLEHAASENGDAFFFQELAEAASRSDGKLIVIGVLHQAFDDYAYRLARETRDDWLKIQGRWVDIPLNPSSEEQVDLLSKAIDCDLTPQEYIGVPAIAESLGDTSVAGSISTRLKGCWPLGPVVACLLGPLSRRRFGQNQRSLFGFLTSAEPYGFQDYLETTRTVDAAPYDTDWFWRYLQANLEPSIMASPDSHRWSLALDAIDRCETAGVEASALSVLRAVALLDMFRERSGLVASKDILAAALPQLSAGEISTALQILREKAAIIYRRHLDAFTLYAGSDFDIERAIEDAYSSTAKCDFTKLKGTGALSPVLAKREYHETGAMRWFEVDISGLDDAGSRIQAFDQDDGAAGLFLLLIDEGGNSKTALKRQLSKLAQSIGDRPIAIGVSPDSYMLRELSRELIALEKVQNSRPELKGDAVARREVASRLARVSGELEDRLRHGLTAISWQLPDLIRDEVAEHAGPARDLSVVASRLATAIFPKTPHIPNELVNRAKPSSNAVGAMRALMNLMITSADEPRLGIEKHPPELGLYVSLLERTGLHRAGSNGKFSLAEPTEDSAGLLPLWQAADDAVSQAGPDGLGLDAIFSLWNGRPYGLKEGLHPVFGLAYILSRREKIAVYLDGVFSSTIGDLLVDRLLQDSDSIHLRYSEISKDDAAILRGVSDVLIDLTGDEIEAAEPLTIGRRLVSLVMEAPSWVRRTSRLSDDARKVRDLAIAAHDPNKFMLDDIPAIVSGGTNSDSVVDIIRSGLVEITAAYENMLQNLESILLQELRVDDRDDFSKLHERSKGVMGVTGNFRLDAFATRLTSYDGSLEVLEGLASLAANKPPRDWVDRDVDAARIELAALAREFLRTEGFVYVNGRAQSRFAVSLYTSDPESAGVISSELDLDAQQLKQARAIADTLRDSISEGIDRDVAIAAAASLASTLATEKTEGSRLRSSKVSPAILVSEREK
ncbi:ATP-binding protein [Erythrobacter litoralis]|uniref:hypothetical protein n=1 Tax=Erythrobacter litoralis TaxID=39960 RepID=UPI002434D93C|nr:hypothetical protein [Erythrobacter litoralis]MDG6079020.1 ATP-binding protein [Erythrobacter litoralis]